MKAPCLGKSLVRLSKSGRAPPRSRVSAIMPSMPIGERCAERAKFAHAVAQAVLSLNARSREYQDARDRKENPEQISIALTAARDAERAAVHDYDEHIKKHGCIL